MSIISFAEQILAPVRATAEALGDEVEEIISDYAPSIVTQAIEGGSVTIDVENDEPLWTDSLERLIREHVTAFTDSTGAPCRLIVSHPE